MIVRPSSTGLGQLHRSFLSLSKICDRTQTILKLNDELLQKRILSAYYYFADEEVAAINIWYTPALAMCIENVVLGNEVRLQFQPLILTLPAKIAKCFFEMAGPEKSKALNSLRELLRDAFENFKPVVIVGFKAGLWGGQKPVTERMNLPLVEGIDQVFG
jgi:hypothetical protein